MSKKTYVTKAHFELYDTYIPIFRFVVIICIIITAAVSRNLGPGKLENTILLSAYLLYSVLLLLFKRLRYVTAFQYPLILGIFEILLSTYGVVCLGGSDSPFFLMYFVIISFYATVYHCRYSMISGALSSAGYITALFLLGEGLSFESLCRVIFLFAFSCFSGFVNERLKEYNLQMATIDPLTRLYNRQYFYDEFENILEENSKSHTDVSLLVFDVDNFKMINDRSGHLEGDRILTEIGEIIGGIIRNRDIAARFGGDEFVIVLPKSDRSQVDDLCEQLNRQITERFYGMVSISIGKAVFPENGVTFKELFHAADMDMYQIKALKKQAGGALPDPERKISE